MATTEKISGRRAAWITWEIQVRNRSMAKALGIPLYELTSKKSRLLKYPLLIIRTIQVIVKNKTRVLFVQNPSIVLSFLAICLKPVFGLRVIVDAHNGGIYPLEGKSKILNFFARLICRKADYVIVTNSYIAQTVSEWGGQPFVMPDPIPDFSEHTVATINASRPYFLFICTWADDEPYHEVIKAAAQLENIDIYITGKYKNKLNSQQIETLPPQVTLLGFVSEEDYINYLRNSLAIIDLTTRDNCLVCGGYEAVSLEKPAVLSKSIVNMEVFNQGVILTDNHASAISASLQEAVKKIDILKAEIKNLKYIHLANNQKHAQDLKILTSITY